MLENPNPNPAESPASSKRYVPPNQRNRRKSGDHHHRSEPPPSSSPCLSRSDAETSRSTFNFIPVNGCSSSEAFRLLRQRWDATMTASHDPSSVPDRPVMYRGPNPELQLPHQLISSPASESPMDFLVQLRRAMDDKINQERQ